MTPIKQEQLETTIPENITLETFHNITVRKVIQNGRGMIPVLDITSATSLDRGNVSRLLKRNEKFFAEYQGVVKITTPGGVQSLTCLTRDGIMGLLFKVDAARAKDPLKQDTIIEFQHWATEILGKQKVGQDIQVLPVQTKQTTLDCINHYLDIADIAVKRSGVPKDIAHKQAWAIAATETKADMCTATASFLQSKQSNTERLLLGEAIPDDKVDYERMFSLTDVSDFVRKTPQQVKEKLKELRITFEMNNMWHLTKTGEDYGKVFFITPGAPYNMTRRPFIKYNDKLVQLLKEVYGVKVPVTRIQE